MSRSRKSFWSKNSIILPGKWRPENCIRLVGITFKTQPGTCVPELQEPRGTGGDKAWWMIEHITEDGRAICSVLLWAQQNVTILRHINIFCCIYVCLSRETWQGGVGGRVGSCRSGVGRDNWGRQSLSQDAQPILVITMRANIYWVLWVRPCAMFLICIVAFNLYL